MSLDDVKNDARIQPSEFNEKTMLEMKQVNPTSATVNIENLRAGERALEIKKSITTPIAVKKTGRPAGLTMKARSFLEHLIAGKSPKEAYQLAGYTGKHPQLPYKLKYQLKDQLFEMLEAHGVSKEGVFLETKKLLDLPLHSEKTFVTFDEKMSLLRFIHKLLPEERIERPKITPFIVAINNAETVVMPKERLPKIAEEVVANVIPEEIKKT